MGPDPDYHDKLLDVLLDVTAFNDPLAGLANRTMLLHRLPAGPVAAIPRYPAPITDLNSIVTHAAGMGQLLDSGEWALAIVTRNASRFARGTDAERALAALLAELETRAAPPPQATIPEIVIGQDERLPVRFLGRGLEASLSVAKILVTRVLNGKLETGSGSRVSGTGWMIAPGLLLTNHHVIEARDSRIEAPAADADFLAQAKTADVWFDYHDESAQYWDYAGWELAHASRKLDYALLRSMSPAKAASRALSDWGFLTVVPERPELTRGARLNIIQHPQGGPKRLAIRSNFYFDCYSTAKEPDRLRYLTDTEPGSSGSPVFGDDWRVLALHHAAVAIPEEKYRGEVIKYNNQGICMVAIMRDLPSPISREIGTAQGWF
jgi:V8-like Glu-specific endopeptidase